jgi:hypothetical protein
MDMAGRIPKRLAGLSVALVAAAGVLALSAGAASASITFTPLYNNIASPLPGNVPSEAIQATSTSEFGGQVELAGPVLTTTKVKVAMSSWACQSGGAEDGSCVTAPGAKFEWPVTLHIYAVGVNNSVGTEVARITKTFKMPYRPSANNVKCTGSHLGGWVYKGQCFHGKLFSITYLLRGVAVPSKAIISVSFNTESYGAEPTGVEGPYNSLNVAGFTGSPSVGVDPQPESVYINSLWTGAYCDAGLTGTGSFRFDPAVPGECLPNQNSYDGFDHEGLQPGFQVLTG